MATSSSSAVQTIESVDALTSAQAGAGNSDLWVLMFWADWHAASAPGGSLNSAFSSLAATQPSSHFATVEAEAVDDLSDQFDISVVPTFVFLRGTSVLDKVEGGDTAVLAATVMKHATAPAPKPAATATATATKSASAVDTLTPALEARLRSLVSSSHVMLFMKGTPEAPKCKFSRAMIGILSEEDAKYASFNILEDPEVRAGLKIFSKWPTFPQVYVAGKLLGGLDVIKELKEDDELKDALAVAEDGGAAPAAASAAAATGGSAAPAAAAPTTEALEKLINQSKVMLFMKGNPDTPRCGFSATMIEILRTHPNIKFGTFDILGDNGVRQALKEYSKWPTYPQLYVDGKLVGGLDVVKELQEEDELADALQGN